MPVNSTMILLLGLLIDATRNVLHNLKVEITIAHATDKHFSEELEKELGLAVDQSGQTKVLLRPSRPAYVKNSSVKNLKNN
jgi:hypothetical protein